MSFSKEIRSFSSSSSSSKLTKYSVSKTVISSSSTISEKEVSRPIIHEIVEEKILQENENGDIFDFRSINEENFEQCVAKISKDFSIFIEGFKNEKETDKIVNKLENLNEVLTNAWTVPYENQKLAELLCNTLRKDGALDILITNCENSAENVEFSSAKLLENSLNLENTSHVIDNGLLKVVKVACRLTDNLDYGHTRVGTGLIENLLKGSVDTCTEILNLGGLDAILNDCRMLDTETLIHCSNAITNICLFGGPENLVKVIDQNTPLWLFSLAFNNDEIVKYYSCLAIANLAYMGKITDSETLALIDQFLANCNPKKFVTLKVIISSQKTRKIWLTRLVPLLSSHRMEVLNMVMFHFMVEALILKAQNKIDELKKLGLQNMLKQIVAHPNGYASKLAEEILELLNEEVPRKLSQIVPQWSVQDVVQWIDQIGFQEYKEQFIESKVDGDLLLKMTELNLKDDISIKNGIKRKRFLRELDNLKKIVEYTWNNPRDLKSFLKKIDIDLSIYAYSMNNAGVTMNFLNRVNNEQLEEECGILNSIHRQKILDQIDECFNQKPTKGKKLDAFISYRRSNGAQLASLLKVYLQLRGYSVFLDIEQLPAGHFDKNLINNIKSAKNFLLVLTENALQRCLEDTKNKDWVRKVIKIALPHKLKDLIFTPLDDFYH